MKRKYDIDKELEKYRSLIDKGYVDESDTSDLNYDITMLCVKKKLQRDQSIYGKIRGIFFDNKNERKKR